MGKAPLVITGPNDEINFIFPYPFNILESRVDQGKWGITWSIRNCKVACRSIIILVEICSLRPVLQQLDRTRMVWDVYRVRRSRICSVIPIFWRSNSGAIIVFSHFMTCRTYQ